MLHPAFLDDISDAVGDDVAYGAMGDDEYGGLGIFRIFLKLPKRIADILETYEKLLEKDSGIAEWRVRRLAKTLARLIPKQLKKNPKWQIPELALDLLEDGGQEEAAAQVEAILDRQMGGSSPSSSPAGDADAKIDGLAAQVTAKKSAGDEAGAKDAGRKLAKALEAKLESQPDYEPSDAVYEALEASGIDDEVFGATEPRIGHDTAQGFLMELAGRSPHLHSRPYQVDGVWVVPSQVAALSRHRVKGWLRGFMEGGQIEPGVSAGLYRLGDHFHAIFGTPEEVKGLLRRLPATQVIAYVPPLRGHTRTISHAELEDTSFGSACMVTTDCMQMFSQDPTQRPAPGRAIEPSDSSLQAAIYAGVQEALLR